MTLGIATLVIGACGRDVLHVPPSGDYEVLTLVAE